jgi:hypothetical protein
MSKYNKFLVALAAAVEEVITLNVLHGTAQTVAVTIGAVLGALGVVAIPNAVTAVK